MLDEQWADPTLAKYHELAKDDKSDYYYYHEILVCDDKSMYGLSTMKIVLPQPRRKSVLHLAHESTTASHCSIKRTQASTFHLARYVHQYEEPL